MTNHITLWFNHLNVQFKKISCLRLAGANYPSDMFDGVVRKPELIEYGLQWRAQTIDNVTS